VNISDAWVPSIRATDAEEPFTPEESVSMFVEETLMSARFCGKKKPPAPLTDSA
jgi:hypothetical protein